MGLTSSPDINYRIDSNSTSSHIEKRQEGGTNFNGVVDNINLKLELDGLRLELPKTIEQQEKEVKNIVSNNLLKEAIENSIFNKGIKAKYIDNNIFSIQGSDSKKVSIFVNNKGELLMNMGIHEDGFRDKNGELYPFAIKSMKMHGFYCDFKDGRNLYKILGKDKNGEFILDNNPIDIYSKEYYNKWKEIIKTDSTLLLLMSLKQLWKENENSISNYILSGALNIKFLLLIQEKGLLEKPELFEYAIREMKTKESDVKSALEKGDITKKQAMKIFQILPDSMRDLSE